MPCVVAGRAPGPVFDAWGWCASDVIAWRRLDPWSASSTESSIDGKNPADLVFVLHEDADCTFLPRELARLHAIGYGLTNEWALAPWAIDDATDLFFEHGVRPRDVLWLAAPSLDALVWGLHDWVHFHNHGPFDQPAMTELQCDLVALAWLRLNREAIGVGDREIERVACDLAALSRSRFANEGLCPPHDDLEALFAGPYPSSL
ncbi:MAG: hypothetical protein KF819_27645 [Labilithrix sp.]|nr:hypothetical protein [Labilithrix sp.]